MGTYVRPMEAFAGLIVRKLGLWIRLGQLPSGKEPGIAREEQLR